MSELTIDRFEYEAYEYGQAASDNGGVFERAANEDFLKVIPGRSLLEDRDKTTLTAEQEVELAFCIQRGLRASEILEDQREDAGALDAAERKELERQASLGLQARNTMVERNIGLVYSHVGNFLGRGIDQEELVQVGIGVGVSVDGETVKTGLIRAAELFDPTQGNKFSTYAQSWIKNSMQRYVWQHVSSVRLPYGVVEQIRPLAKAEIEQGETEGQNLNDVQLAAQLSISKEKLAELRLLKRQFYRGNIDSLDMPVGDESSFTVGDFVPDETYNPQSEQRIANMDLERAIGSLSARKQVVVRMSLDMKEDGSPLTEQEMAHRIGYTVPALRQDLRGALEALKAGLAGDEYAVVEPTAAALSQARSPTPDRRAYTAPSSSISDIVDYSRTLEHISDEEQSDILDLIALSVRADHAGDEGMRKRVVEERRRLTMEYTSLIMKRVYAHLKEFPQDDIDELVQAGFVATTEAIDSYAIVRNQVNTSLGAYVGNRVFRAVQRTSMSIGLATEIPQDSFTQHNMYRYMRARNAVYDEGRQPHPPLIGKELGLSSEDSYALERLTRRPYHVIDPPGSVYPAPESFIDEYTETNTPPSDVALQRVLLLMPPKEAELLRLNYGMDDGHALTPEEIDQRMGYKKGAARGMINMAQNRMHTMITSLSDASFDIEGWVDERPVLKNPLTFFVRCSLPVPEDAATVAELADRAAMVLDSMVRVDARTKDVLVNMYGLKAGPRLDYKALAAKYGVSANTVARIEARFLASLRSEPAIV